jgi:hypothetical protein
MLARMKDEKSDFTARPTLGSKAASGDPVLIAGENQPLPPLPLDRDPKPLRALCKYEREIKQQRNALQRLVDTEYRHHHTAKRALENVGFQLDSFDCPYAIEQRYSAENSMRKVWKVVEDFDGQIKGAQHAHKKNLVGRQYGSSAAAYTALARKGHRLSDPQCPFRVVKVAPTIWRIDIRLDEKDRIDAAKKAIREQMPFLSDPEQQEQALAYVAAQIHDIYK